MQTYFKPTRLKKYDNILKHSKLDKFASAYELVCTSCCYVSITPKFINL